MAIGTSLFLTALGAILWFAVQDSIEGVDLETVGMILTIIGLVGLAVGLWMWRSANRSTTPIVRDDRY
jgi:protein-S-isoprenylcysteine O-methyltransferase Ste14